MARKGPDRNRNRYDLENKPIDLTEDDLVENQTRRGKKSRFDTGSGPRNIRANIANGLKLQDTDEADDLAKTIGKSRDRVMTLKTAEKAAALLASHVETEELSRAMRHAILFAMQTGTNLENAPTKPGFLQWLATHPVTLTTAGIALGASGIPSAIVAATAPTIAANAATTAAVTTGVVGTALGAKGMAMALSKEQTINLEDVAAALEIFQKQRSDDA